MITLLKVSMLNLLLLICHPYLNTSPLWSNICMHVCVSNVSNQAAYIFSVSMFALKGSNLEEAGRLYIVLGSRLDVSVQN